ncbi:MAG TPA: CPBP family intramembrane metalloprotease [Phycisphaerales bacterium]|nr:CPBP family intramembrane metalloprotease [Phycisphaerales bacterium]
MTKLWVMVLFAAGGFFVLFSPWTKEAIAFWPMMCLTTGLLAVGSMALDRRGQLASLGRPDGEAVLIGLVSATVLYVVFWAGHWISTRALPFAAGQVNSIYTIREGVNLWQIALLLALIIAPAEEIFWRGFVQRQLCGRYGLLCGFALSTAIYAGVHLWSFNVMLIAAAAIGGAFWGLLFLATERFWPCIVSHIVWDVMIFVLWPIH